MPMNPTPKRAVSKRVLWLCVALAFLLWSGVPFLGAAEGLRGVPFTEVTLADSLWARRIETNRVATVAPGRHFVIRADQPTDENSLEDPLRLVPREQPLPNSARQFTVTLPPLSVNVLTIPANRP